MVLGTEPQTARLNADQDLQVQGLGELITEGRAKLIALIRQELLSGIKTMAQFEKLREFLRAFRDEPGQHARL